MNTAPPLCIRSVKPHATVERWPLTEPFRIAGHIWETLDVLRITLEKDGQIGQGEAAGVYYKNDVPTGMLEQVEALRHRIEDRISREELQQWLPAGGARNALDCALWDLEAKLRGCDAWQFAQLSEPKPLLTTFTCGAGEPEAMAAKARAYIQARAIKVKLTGDGLDAERVRAVRGARPDVWLGVDANQGFSRETLLRLIPQMVEMNVSLIEQPLPAGREFELAGIESSIPFAADESIQTLTDLRRVAPYFRVVNIKLDKCGGLTEALSIARAAKALRLEVMVGNMLGTSLAMAPAFLVGQLCKVVDLDGPIFLQSDRSNHVYYSQGCISCPTSLWGGTR